MQPPTTSVDAQVTIASSVPASQPDAYMAMQSQSSQVQAQSASVDATMITSTLTVAVPDLASNLAVTAPVQTVIETNAPPSTPPPLGLSAFVAVAILRADASARRPRSPARSGLSSSARQ